MFPGNPNPFLQAAPGKVVLDIQRKRMPSGQIAEIRIVEVTVLDNGRWHREKVREYEPDLADGTRPDMGLIRECHVCLRLWHAANVTRCLACGRDYCRFRECRGKVRMSEDESIILCALCAHENNMGLLSRLSRKFWRLEK